MTSISVAYKTINLKESILGSLLFDCYLGADDQQSQTPVPAVQLPRRGGHCPHLPASAHRSAVTASPRSWWVGPCQRSLVQIKPSKTCRGSVGTWAELVRLLFGQKKLRSVNNSFCGSLHWQSASGGGWRGVGVSNLFHWHHWIWERVSICILHADECLVAAKVYII